jgi:NAD(P)-dependent dehydrogenase (short-subunit alcohol dehydrogenase family)
MDFEYTVAEDFNRAWLNFELDLPLKPGPLGAPNPFYVDRPGNPLAELEDALLSPYFQPPKFFFSGHRGCGKSTELLRLSASLDINRQFWPVHFSIRDEADINDLDFRDVLLAIGGRLYRDYRASGRKLPAQLIKELDGWRGQIQTEVRTVLAGRTEVDLEAGVDAFFANAGLKVKLEPATRSELRQVFERNVTGLIRVINDIAVAIQSQTHRMPLVLIDDLDKPDPKLAEAIFKDRREIMLQPNCAIVYTISSALFYSKEFEAIRDRAVFLPNVKLHSRQRPAECSEEGCAVLRSFVHKRMSSALFAPGALDEAIRNSGGVFRELGRIIRSSIGRARRRKAAQVEQADVAWAIAEIRNEYRRILDEADRQFLRQAHQRNVLESHERLRPLLQLLALLEYRNAENWCDVHPALEPLLEEETYGNNQTP